MVPDLNPQDAQLATLYAELRALRAEVAKLRQVNHTLREDNQALRDEVARLKGHKGKPNIGPSRLAPDPKPPAKKGARRSKLSAPRLPRVETLKPLHVPPGSRFKGYSSYRVQELILSSELIEYRLERWLTPDGELLTAPLPPGQVGSHFGPTLRQFVLYQYHHAHVTEPLLLEELREWGISLSSGELHRLITEEHQAFHQEKDELLRVGLRVSEHIHVDDTGARHQGKNGFCTHIGNDWFAWFQSTPSKSRKNFLDLLRAGRKDYVLGQSATDYMAQQDLPKGVVERLVAQGEQTFENEAAWEKALQEWGIQSPRHRQVVTEGALLGSALANGMNPELAVMSDDAGQFNVMCHLLCWVHAERNLAKLVGFNDEQRADLEQVRTKVWGLYRDLQAYGAAPEEAAKAGLSERFDELCRTRTSFTLLNLALERLGKNKAELLVVLERPGVPLHNNLSEGDIREYVKRKKMSGGTRSEEGRQGRDTFASLKKTCRKLGVSFWSYLKDRLMGGNLIQPLPQLVEARAQAR